jgi:YD repeat-containing protein
VTNALGEKTRTSYDYLGNLTKVIMPNEYRGEERAYRYRYDFMDRLVRSETPEGTVSLLKRDSEGNITEEV